ncbi:glycosyltransferase family 4 protein [Candidatus Woesearchaeota archaeon]|nr:glycosyltransferase family 4 protein [Candidatus Woesearchaeota archaeon]
MKIALVCPYDIAYPGGVTNHITHFARYARKMGHDVTIIAPASRKIASEGFVSAGKAVPLPVKGGTVSRLGLSFWNFPKIKKLFNSSKFDVIHVHEPEAPLLGLFALAYATHYKSAIIATFHTNSPHNAFTKAYSAFLKSTSIQQFLMKKIDARIAVSKAARQFIARYATGEYTIIPNGVDTRKFTPKAKPIEKFRDGNLNLLFVGRLGNNEKRKGLKYLVTAFNKLHRTHPNTRLIVVGPGKPDGETKKLLRRYGNRSIVFAGKATSEELPRYYATADIFCSPATHGESFGMVLAEAMASGKPVVASDIDGYREVLGKSGKAGILVQPKNADELAAALEKLADSGPLRKRMGANGRWLVQGQFSWDVVALQVLEVYEKVIAAKRQRKIVTAKV